MVVGLGGVGGMAAEMLCRAGIGEMTIADGDAFDETNRNRQTLALSSTTGERKTKICARRLIDVNPELKLTVIDEFIRDEATDKHLDGEYDYIVDAIDTLSPKVNLLVKCKENELPVVSSMGAGGKIDPSLVQVSDIAESFNCKLARVLRKRLRRRGIDKGVKVVFSPEIVPDAAVIPVEDEITGKNSSIVGTVSYMPPLFGCFCASVVIRDLVGAT
jgi:tRNA A37 threonylcarbamoyladenosine dehydratase